VHARRADRRAVLRPLLHRPGAGRGRHSSCCGESKGSRIRDHPRDRQTARRPWSYNATTFHDATGSCRGVFAAARDPRSRNAKRYEQAIVAAGKPRQERLHGENVARDPHAVGTLSRVSSSSPRQELPPANAVPGDHQRSGRAPPAMINDILEMSKIEAGSTTLNPTPSTLPVARSRTWR